MPTPMTRVMVFSYLLAGVAPTAEAQVDQQRAQEYFKEARALCERDGGGLWGVSLCAPMVIADMRTQTIATSQPAPEGTRPRGLGIVKALSVHPETGARSKRRRVCWSLAMAGPVVCPLPRGATTVRSLETDGRSSQHRAGWCAKERGGATTRLSGSDSPR